MGIPEAQPKGRHVRRNVRIIRFPHDAIFAEVTEYLDLDETRPEAMDALVNITRADANMTNSNDRYASHGDRIPARYLRAFHMITETGDTADHDGQFISKLFDDAPLWARRFPNV